MRLWCTAFISISGCLLSFSTTHSLQQCWALEPAASFSSERRQSLPTVRLPGCSKHGVPTAVAASPGSMLEMHGLGPCPKSESAFSKGPSGCSWVHQSVKYCIWGLSRYQVIFLNMAGPSSCGPQWAANLAKANSSCFLGSCSYSCLISIGLGDIYVLWQHKIYSFPVVNHS